MSEHRASSDENLTWHRVLERSALDDSRPRLARAGSKRIAIYEVGGEVYATDNRCPHAAASLGLGTLRGAIVTCPRHEWEFDVRSGACQTLDGFDVTTHPVRIVDGWIEVGVEEDDVPSEDELMNFI